MLSDGTGTEEGGGKNTANRSVTTFNPILVSQQNVQVVGGGDNNSSEGNNPVHVVLDVEEGHGAHVEEGDSEEEDSENAVDPAAIVEQLQKTYWWSELLVFLGSAGFQSFQIYRLCRGGSSQYFIKEFSDIPDVLGPTEDVTAWSLQSCLWGMVLPPAISQLLVRLANGWQGIHWDKVSADAANAFKEIEHRGVQGIFGFMLAAYPPMCLTILIAFNEQNNLFLVNGEVPPDYWHLPTHSAGLTTTPSVDEINVGFPYALTWILVQLMYAAGMSVKNMLFLCTPPTVAGMRGPLMQRIIDAVSFSVVGLLISFPLLVLAYFSIPSGEVTWLSYAATLQGDFELYDFLKSNFSFDSVNPGTGEICVDGSVFPDFSGARNGSRLCISGMKVDPFAGFDHRSQCFPGSLLGQSTVRAPWTFSGFINGSVISSRQTDIASFEICNTAEELAGLELTVCYMLLGGLFYLALMRSFCSTERGFFNKTNHVYKKLVDDIMRHKTKVFVFLFIIFGAMTDILAPVDEARHRFTVALSGVKPLFFGQADQEGDLFSIALLICVVWFTFDVMVWGRCIWHSWEAVEGMSVLQSYCQTLYNGAARVVSAGCATVATCCENVTACGQWMCHYLWEDQSRRTLFGLSLHTDVEDPAIHVDFRETHEI